MEIKSWNRPHETQGFNIIQHSKICFLSRFTKSIANEIFLVLIWLAGDDWV